MIRQSIKRQIVSIAVGLVILMVITSSLSMVMAGRVGLLLNELTTRYIPAYGHLTRMDVRSLERALALRRMVIARMLTPPDEAGYAEQLKIFETKGLEVEREAVAARKLINAIIEDVTTPSDNAALGRIDIRIEVATSDLRRHLDDEVSQMLPLLDERHLAEARHALARVETFRDEFNQRVDSIRADMLGQVDASAATVMRDQQRTILVSAILTALAAIFGLIFAVLVSGGITRPVRRLLEGTRAVEAGRLDGSRRSRRVMKLANCRPRSIAWLNNCVETYGSEKPLANILTQKSWRD
jgi:hypothetical protein